MEDKLKIKSYHHHITSYGEEISVLSIPLSYQSHKYKCSVKNINILIKIFNDNKDIMIFSGVQHIINHLTYIKKHDKKHRYDLNGNEKKLYVAFLSTVLLTYKNMYEAYLRASFNQDDLNWKEYRWYNCATDRELGVCESIIQYFDELLSYIIIDEPIKNINKYTKRSLKNANDKFNDMYNCIREIDNCSDADCSDTD